MTAGIRRACDPGAASRRLAALLLTSGVALPIGVAAQAGGNTRARVEIPGTELRAITSEIVGREYTLHIHLPAGYDSGSETYPVLFLLDSQWDFPLVTAIYGQQYYDGFLPALVIVGVTWGGRDPDPDLLRARDFTPTSLPRPAGSGNAARFLAFLRDELVPFIEANYRVKPDRTLMGSSLGGLFTLYAMLEATSVFDRYVLTSPAAGWDDGWIYRLEDAYSNRARPLPARLYMAIGGLEGGVADFERLAAQLASRSYSDFEMSTRILDGIGHSGSKAEGYTRGLQAVFARPSLALSPAILERHHGEYVTEAGARYTVATEGGRLVLAAPNGTRTTLLAESDSTFYANGEFLKVRFSRGDAGRSSTMYIERFGGREVAHRVAGESAEPRQPRRLPARHTRT